MSEISYDYLAKQPIPLLPNRVWRTYSGGKLIDQWQEQASPADSSFPEEWIASVVKASNVGREEVDEGCSRIKLTDGSEASLLEVIASDPKAFLGKAHVDRYGAKTAVLVKLLDSSERLTIQVHPDRPFAMNKLHSAFGKTEAWYVLGGRSVNGEEPYVLFGFKPGMTAVRWRELFEQQDKQGMIDALHRIPVREGEVYLIEGGMPHAIGSGCFMIEIQEPTDYTFRTERITPQGIEVPDQACHQGLGFDEMLECFHYDTYSIEEIKERWFIMPTTIEESAGGKLSALIKETDTDRFRMSLLTVTNEYQVMGKESFAIAIVIEGSGKLVWEGGEAALAQGRTFFLPASLQEANWIRQSDQELKIVLCFPPVISGENINKR